MSRPIPKVMWISLVALGAMIVLQLLTVPRIGPPSALLSALLWAGLYYGYRAAFIATFLIIVAKVVICVGSGREFWPVLAVDSLVAVPLIFSADYFFGRRSAAARESA